MCRTERRNFRWKEKCMCRQEPVEWTDREASRQFRLHSGLGHFGKIVPKAQWKWDLAGAR